MQGNFREGANHIAPFFFRNPASLLWDLPARLPPLAGQQSRDRARVFNPMGRMSIRPIFLYDLGQEAGISPSGIREILEVLEQFFIYSTLGSLPWHSFFGILNCPLAGPLFQFCSLSPAFLPRP